ncbi:hypothetical protein AAEX28_15915 [Lentisphaerota bacterium WC36G]|nr:hypothetical protein LJT99_02675 [Lentisphaerae bacterium WC36]
MKYIKIKRTNISKIFQIIFFKIFIFIFITFIFSIILIYWLGMRNYILIKSRNSVKNKLLKNMLLKDYPELAQKKSLIISCGNFFRRNYHLFILDKKNQKIEKELAFNYKSNSIDIFMKPNLKDGYYYKIAHLINFLRNNNKAIPKFLINLKNYKFFRLKNDKGNEVMCFFNDNSQKIIYYIYYRPNYENRKIN